MVYLYGQVKNVYYSGNTGTMFERQSPYKEQAGVWGNDNFSGLYTTSKGSSLLAYWYQSFDTVSQILAVLFQELGANSLTIGKYTSNSTYDNPWVDTAQSIAIQDGSSLAVAPIGSRRDLRLYIGDPSGTLKQYQYNLTSDALTNPICMYLTTSSFSASFVHSTLIHAGSIPSFSKHLPVPATNAHLREHAGQPAVLHDGDAARVLAHDAGVHAPDPVRIGRRAGPVARLVELLERLHGPARSRIAAFLRPGRAYLALANTLTSLDAADQRIYVLYDDGAGPAIEERQVPPGGQHADWKVLGSVPVNVTGS